MPHPCIPNWNDGGDQLHQCHSTSSTKTTCKKKSITAQDIDKTDGARLKCLDCYPGAKGKPGPDNTVLIG